MDFFVVAILIQRSLEMFASVLGTWIPVALIFLSTYLTGLYVSKKTQWAVLGSRIALDLEWPGEWSLLSRTSIICEQKHNLIVV
jgi:hypothetical protein